MIRYTLDGSTPSETAGILYSGPFTIISATTVNAIAYGDGMADSAVASATYTISCISNLAGGERLGTRSSHQESTSPGALKRAPLDTMYCVAEVRRAVRMP